MKVCPHCHSANTYKQVRSGKHRCRKCGKAFSKLLDIPVDQDLYVGNVTSSCVDNRIERIREVHNQNPMYTIRDLVMVCFESEYMVRKYFKLIKTV